MALHQFPRALVRSRPSSPRVSADPVQDNCPRPSLDWRQSGQNRNPVLVPKGHAAAQPDLRHSSAGPVGHSAPGSGKLLAPGPCRWRALRQRSTARRGRLSSPSGCPRNWFSGPLPDRETEVQQDITECSRNRVLQFRGRRLAPDLVLPSARFHRPPGPFEGDRNIRHR
jgi:hypothetical protein